MERTYCSPFEGLNFYKSPIKNKTSSLRETLETLKAGLASPIPLADSTYFKLCPAEIIRFILEYKIKNPTSEGALALVPASVDFGLGFYSDPHDYSNFEQFEQLVLATVSSETLDQPQIQAIDDITWQALNPIKSQSTAERLTNMSWDDLLVIALAQGGIPAGLDVFSYYKDLTKSENSIFYPVRFSRRKLSDGIPQVSPLETTVLRGLAEGRQAIIFDEDVGSRQTLSVAKAFFNQILPGKVIRAATNFDPHNKLTASGFWR